jgi:cell wall assembly regulator SMI1
VLGTSLDVAFASKGQRHRYVAGVEQSLSFELLEELEKRWHDQRAPIARQLQPGLTLADMEALVAPVALALPKEAQVWWAWHNGAQRADLGVPVGFSHDSLQVTVESAEFHRRLAREVAPDDPSGMWNWDWLPFSADITGAALVIEGRTDSHVSPVSVHLNDDPSDIPMSAPSMAALVAQWIEMLDAGACGYDRVAGCWHHDLQRVPATYDRRLI